MAEPFRRKSVDIGLLILRIGIGATFIHHGLGKLMGGAPVWEAVGGEIRHFGITFGYPFWGLAAALAELIGAILLMLGVLVRPACVVLVFVMAVAVASMVCHVDPARHAFSEWAYAFSMGVVFLGLLFTGPGGLRAKLARDKNRTEERG